MKNVLIIVYYYPPMGGSGVQRPLKFVKYLHKFGWNPIVLCPEPGAYHTFDDSLAQELEKLNVVVHRVAGNTPLHKTGSQKKVILPNWLEGLLRKISIFFWLPDNKKGWIKQAEVKARELIAQKNIQIVYATAAPYSNLVLAANIKKSISIPVVMDLRDEWLDSHLIKYPTSWHKQKMKAIEKETLSYADVVTVINEPYKESIGKRYPDLAIQVIRQGFDPEDFELVSTDAKREKKLVLLYSGLFYGDRKPDVFLECVSELIQQNGHYKDIIELHFQGGLGEQTKLLINKLGLQDNVVDYGYLQHKEAVQNIKKADVLWLMVGHLQHSEKVTVGKMFEYFGTKKPILALVPKGGTIDLLESYGAFYSAKPNSKEDIKKALMTLIKDYESNSLPVANDEFVMQYNRVTITGELAAIFNQLVEPDKGNDVINEQ